MKKRSSNYSSFDSGGWTVKCDDLFLAQFRGLPCEICGARGGWDGKKKSSSCGHHLHHKGNCRKFRYDRRNIVVLCPNHHSKWSKHISPHCEVNGFGISRFNSWLRVNKPEQYKWWRDTEAEASKPFDKTWTARGKYQELGGEIESKTGLMKDYRPVRHGAKVDALVARNKETKCKTMR